MYDDASVLSITGVWYKFTSRDFYILYMKMDLSLAFVTVPCG